MEHKIYLVVQFNWPRPFERQYGEMAKKLHELLQGQDWIEEVVAGSGGIGGGPSSLWVLRLDGYASLERLFHDREDAVAQAYASFFGAMVDVEDFVREAVVFL